MSNSVSLDSMWVADMWRSLDLANGDSSKQPISSLRPATVDDLIEVFEGMGAETLEAWLSEDPEFGDDLWALPVEKRGDYLVLPLPTPKEET